MECPFCLREFSEDAIVCGSCGRDLRLVRPLVRENLALVAQIEDLEVQVDRARAAIERSAAPLG
jgi:hypothetical protein